MFGKGGNDQGVVSMTERERAKRLTPLRTVEAYWQGLRDGQNVPLRSQVDPRGMENALENAFLMERIAPGMAKIRVAGSHMSDLMGMQMAGMPFSSLIAPEDRDQVIDAVKRLFAEPAIVRVRLTAEGGFGKPQMQGDLILLPLRSDFGDITRCLGAIVTHGRIGRTPRRFYIQSIDVSPVSETHGFDALTPAEAPKAGLPAPRARTPEPSGLRETVRPFRHAKGNETKSTANAKPTAKGKGTPHLRLVVSND